MHAYVEPTKVEFILNKLDIYHPNINFTFELQKNTEINFLDILTKRFNSNKLETCMFWKSTSTDICLKWNVHASTEWKISTLRYLIKQAELTCSGESLDNKEMKHLKKVFQEVNNYSMSIINKVAQRA